MPIRQLADIAHARGAHMHTDAAQGVGKVPARVLDLGVDLLSLASPHRGQRGIIHPMAFS